MPPRSARERLRPAASPVDTFIRPPADRADAVLESLAALDPELTRFTARNARESAERELEEGTQLARDLERSGKSYAEAIQAGEIHPSESPWFRMGAHEQMGRAAAGKFYGDFQAELVSSGIGDSATDLKAFDKLAQDFLKSWTEQNVGESNEHFQRGFAKVDEDISRIRAQYAGKIGENLVQQNADDYLASQTANLRRLTETGEYDAAAVAATLQEELDRQVAVGGNKKMLNSATIEAVAAVAYHTRDLSLFDVLKNVKAGPASLFDRGGVPDIVNETRNRIMDVRADEDRERKRIEEAELELVVNESFSGAIDEFQRSRFPSSVDLTQYIDRLQNIRGGYVYADNLVQLQRTFAGKATEGDPRIENDMIGELVLDANFSASAWKLRATQAMNAGRIGRDAFGTILSYINQKEADGTSGEGGAVLSDPSFARMLAALKDVYGGENMPDTGPARGAASQEFIASWVRWRTASPEGLAATEEQKVAFLGQQIQRIQRQFPTNITDAKTALSRFPTPATGTNEPAWKTRDAGISTQSMRALIDLYATGGAEGLLSDDNALRALQFFEVDPAEIGDFLRRQAAFHGLGGEVR